MSTDSLDPMTPHNDEFDERPPADPGEEAPEGDVDAVEAAELESATVDPTEPVRTGNPRVDAVLDSLESLDDLPVSDHVAVFERAHDELRRALDPDPDA